MYHWRAVYLYKRKTFVMFGLFRYYDEQNAIREFEILGRMKAYKFLRGVPMFAKCLSVKIVTEQH